MILSHELFGMPIIQLSPQLALHTIEINPHGSPVVLLLHGLGATGESWGLQFPALQEAGFRVLAPDVRGFGKSTNPKGRLTIRDLARDMALLLNYLQAHPAHIVGISMGGAIALQLTLDYPNLVHRLVLVNTFSRLRPGKPSPFSPGQRSGAGDKRCPSCFPLTRARAPPPNVH